MPTRPIAQADDRAFTSIAIGSITPPPPRAPELVVDGKEVRATLVDWAAVTGIPSPTIDAIGTPTWLDIAVPGDAAVLTMSFAEGPLPGAVSVVGYEQIGSDGMPVGDETGDHGILPVAGVAEVDGHLTLDTTGQSEYVAVQFRWSVPPSSRATGQFENASVAAAYLIHLR